MNFWAKTTGNAQPGISVRDHCLNVGCVAQALVASSSGIVQDLFPLGTVPLAALHDVGKITCGFQVKCPAWLVREGLMEAAFRERWAQPQQAEGDHAKVSQFFLQGVLKATGTHLWAVAAGVHHGRIFGRTIRPSPNVIGQREQWEIQARLELLAELVAIFGPLPGQPPGKNEADLWCVAGLISVADWIGSNEAFFSSDHGLTLDESRRAAEGALQQIGWGGGKFRQRPFGGLFEGYAPKPLQEALQENCTRPGLYILEGPMGCGKTEAALWAAHRLIAAGASAGFYFALPTQVTSNRIHERVARFLTAALEDAARLRLAHGASWLEDCQTVELRPTIEREEEREHVREGRSWFASAKHALLARFGVGTIDQALQGVVAVKHFFVRRFGLAGKVVILDEVHSYDLYTGTLIACLIRELLALRCTVIVLSATLTRARRRELVAAAGGDAAAVGSTTYPLITVVTPDAGVHEILAAAEPPRTVRLRTAAFSETDILEECVVQAEAGQHVLYLRNTVVEAQAACRALKTQLRAERVVTGLLHSRFPYFRRQELEKFWLDRLGTKRAEDGKGSILIATQVVEQSVDIDLDFIVSDLAPTDMLLQRMGRLWRHARTGRRAAEPEFWINAPALDPAATARELQAAFGKSGLVYAPYVLLRTAAVFAGRESIILPDEIRCVLEDTYAERPDTDESPAWRELRATLDKTRETQAALARSATKVLGQQALPDLEGMLTRLRGAPTRDVVLLRACEPISRDRWRLTPLDGESMEVSDYQWSLEAARLLHRQVVHAPFYTVPRQEAPPWLSLHVQGGAAWALVRDGKEECIFPDAEDESALAYSPLFGLYNRPGQPQPRRREEDDDDYDDEFDS